jgi:hypothetical protein
MDFCFFPVPFWTFFWQLTLFFSWLAVFLEQLYFGEHLLQSIDCYSLQWQDSLCCQMKIGQRQCFAMVCPVRHVTSRVLLHSNIYAFDIQHSVFIAMPGRNRAPLSHRIVFPHPYDLDEQLLLIDVLWRQVVWPLNVRSSATESSSLWLKNSTTAYLQFAREIGHPSFIVCFIRFTFESAFCVMLQWLKSAVSYW